jgi:hypothetical protein
MCTFNETGVPPWSAVTKRMHICFFGLPVEILRIWGLLMYRYKGIENTFPMVYYMLP